MSPNQADQPIEKHDLDQFIAELDDVVVVTIGAPLSGRAKAASSCCCSSSCCCTRAD
jgi:hypothetical protein